MKYLLIIHHLNKNVSEEHLEADFPFLPRIGEEIEIPYEDDILYMRIEDVTYELSNDLTSFNRIVISGKEIN